MQTRKVTYQADGLTMDSQLFCGPEPGKKPGVLVFPEGFGLGEHALSRASRLASLGYAALACDIYGGRRMYRDMDEARPVMAALRSEVARMRARAQGGLDALKACPEVDSGRIAAIGYCFGGSMALELARSGADIAGVAGFHSGLATMAPQDAKNIKAQVLVCVGADDPAIPPEQRRAFEEEMRAGKVDWQMAVYGGVVHSYTNPEAGRMGRPEVARYDARADARSWRQMCEFFDEVFGRKPGR